MLRSTNSALSARETTFPNPEGGYAELVDRIQQGHPSGMEQLYGIAKNFTLFLVRQLGNEDVQDKVHDVFVTTAQAITSGKLRDPERLVPFVTTVTRFYTYGQIERRSRLRKMESNVEELNMADARVDLEQSAYRRQRREIVTEILDNMKDRDRDLLDRFYMQEQSKEQICREMQLTPTQFRLFKSKAKSRFAKLGAVRLQCGAIAS
ncbi:MAG TPA: sigma-70 family RNA polymerase sigma factor [Bryobacteraceae bacterium]|nr:sigma-70 family RNA polymerase sigma factor [Bryobacteraceae bacterium]